MMLTLSSFAYGSNMSLARIRQRVQLLGLQGQTREALTYYATITDSGLAPYGWYLEHVIRGAEENHLPRPYIEAIRQVFFLTDPDAERDARELAIYQ